jgi:hypothetical protein
MTVLIWVEDPRLSPNTMNFHGGHWRALTELAKSNARTGSKPAGSRQLLRGITGKVRQAALEEFNGEPDAAGLSFMPSYSRLAAPSVSVLPGQWLSRIWCPAQEISADSRAARVLHLLFVCQFTGNPF